MLVNRLFSAFNVDRWAPIARLTQWIVFLWVAWGTTMVFSASFYEGLRKEGDGWIYVKRQLLGTAIALVIFYIVSRIDLKKIVKIAPIFGFTVALLLFVTLIPGLGKTTNGATRWLAIGPLQIQASELIKPFLVIQAANLFGRWQNLSVKFRAIWLAIFGIILLGILAQPNLSTTALCGIGLWIIALAAGLPARYMAGTAFGGVALAVLSMTFREYQRRRVLSFLNPWQDAQGDGFQLVQSLLAIGSGGVFGRGFGFSQQKLDYLPIQYTDFIFAIYAEEWGFIGGIVLLVFLLVFATLGLTIAAQSKQPVSRLIALGATTFIVLQAILNIGVSTGVLPTTGLPLPFFSYGANATISCLAQAGLLVRIARENNELKTVDIARGNRSRRQAKS
jgi:cell division protein FtsW